LGWLKKCDYLSERILIGELMIAYVAFVLYCMQPARFAADHNSSAKKYCLSFVIGPLPPGL
jgi:hypothetical protein